MLSMCIPSVNSSCVNEIVVFMTHWGKLKYSEDCAQGPLYGEDPLKNFDSLVHEFLECSPRHYRDNKIK